MKMCEYMDVFGKCMENVLVVFLFVLVVICIFIDVIVLFLV